MLILLNFKSLVGDARFKTKQPVTPEIYEPSTTAILTKGINSKPS